MNQTITTFEESLRALVVAITELPVGKVLWANAHVAAPAAPWAALSVLAERELGGVERIGDDAGTITVQVLEGEARVVLFGAGAWQLAQRLRVALLSPRWVRAQGEAGYGINSVSSVQRLTVPIGTGTELRAILTIAYTRSESYQDAAELPLQQVSGTGVVSGVPIDIPPIEEP